MNNFQFVLIDDSNMGAIDLPKIAYALNVQLNRDVARYWPGNNSCRAASGPEDINDGEVPVALVSSIPDPGVIAYHTRQGLGCPALYVSRYAAGDKADVAFGHEIVETVGNYACNLYASDENGTEYARELCDATESDYYEIEGVKVPNFLLSSFFTPGELGPYTYLGTLGRETVAGPFQTAPGGYQITRKDGQVAMKSHPETKVFSFDKMLSIRHPRSRLSRLGWKG